MQRSFWYVAAPFQLEDRRQFQSSKAFQNLEHNGLVDATFDIGIAFLLRDHDKAKWSDFLPEGLVVHRFKPVDDVIYISEVRHEFTLANSLMGLQISIFVERVA